MPRPQTVWAYRPNEIGLPFPLEATWREHVQQFTENWRAGQGRAEKTRALEWTLLLRLLKWVVGEQIAVAEFAEDHAMRFAAHLDTLYQARGANMAIQAARLLGDMMVHEKTWATNPFRSPGVQFRREVRGREAQYLTDEEVIALLAAPDQRKTSGLRDYVVIALLLGTGMRVGEVCRLTGADLYMDSLMLRVAGETAKTRRERWVSIPSQQRGAKRVVDPMLAEPLAAWLRVRAAMGLGPSDALFCGVSRHRGHRELGSAMTPLTLLQTFKRYGRKAGLTRGIHPHMARHYAVRQMRRQGLTADECAAQTGQTTMSALAQYGVTSREHAHEAFGRVNMYGASAPTPERPRVPRPAEVANLRKLLEALGITAEDLRALLLGE